MELEKVNSQSTQQIEIKTINKPYTLKTFSQY